MPGKTQTHPERNVLSAFGLGKLPPAESRAVEAHITQCEPCCQTLLDLQGDDFVDLVRAANEDRAERRDDGSVILLESTHASASPSASPHDGESAAWETPADLVDHPRYRTLELLGRGGMGDVFVAEHRLMHRMVALKVINKELLVRSTVVERFRREVQAAAQLSHANIVTAFDAEQVGDTHFLVMEYVDGTHLANLVKQHGPLSVARACDLICQTAAGLQHAHDCGMIHRDIKPHNLMIASDGRVKILDFGLATIATDAGLDVKRLLADNPATDAPIERGLVHSEAAAASDNRLTSVGCTLGTPDFISPEQAGDARTADARSDIYSLGCTLYFLLAGSPPFAEAAAAEKLKAHHGTEPQAIEELRSDIPPPLASVVARAMAKDPADRFQTPADFALALAPFVETSSATKTAALLRDETAPSGGYRRLVRIAGGVGLIAALILAVMLPDAPPPPARFAPAAKADVDPSDPSAPQIHVANTPRLAPANTSPQPKSLAPASNPNINASKEFPDVFHSPWADATPNVFRSVIRLELVVKRGDRDAQIEYANGTVVSADGFVASVLDEPRAAQDKAIEIESPTLLMLDGSSMAATLVAYEPAYGVAVFRVLDAQLPFLTISKSSLIANRRLTWHAVFTEGQKTFLYTRPVRVHTSAFAWGDVKDICRIVDDGVSALTAERSGSALLALDGTLLGLMGRQPHWQVAPHESPQRAKTAWAVPASVISRMVDKVNGN